MAALPVRLQSGGHGHVAASPGHGVKPTAPLAITRPHRPSFATRAVENEVRARRIAGMHCVSVLPRAGWRRRRRRRFPCWPCTSHSRSLCFLLPPSQEVYDLNEKIDTGKLIDAAGAGKSFTSPGWLTQLGRLWGGASVSSYF